MQGAFEDPPLDSIPPRFGNNTLLEGHLTPNDAFRRLYGIISLRRCHADVLAMQAMVFCAP